MAAGVYSEADRLLATLRLRLPGTTDAALKLELFNTADEFFRKSNAWRYEADVQLTEGATQYPIFPPGGTSLVRVLGVTHRGVPVAAQAGVGSTVSGGHGRFDPDVLETSGDVEFFPEATISPGGVFRYAIFYPTYVSIDIPPSADAAETPLKMVLALTLAAGEDLDDPSAWSLEPWMWERFYAAFEDGVQSRMMSQINKPYANPTIAAFHAKRFRAARNLAKQEAERGFIVNNPSWTFPRWTR